MEGQRDERTRPVHHRCKCIPHIPLIAMVCDPEVDLKPMGSLGSKVTDGAQITFR